MRPGAQADIANPGTKVADLIHASDDVIEFLMQREEFELQRTPQEELNPQVRRVALQLMQELAMVLECDSHSQTRLFLNAVQYFDADTATVLNVPIENVLARAAAAWIVAEKLFRDQHRYPGGVRRALQKACQIACALSQKNAGGEVFESDIMREERALLSLTGFRVCMTSPCQFIEVSLSRFSLASGRLLHADLTKFGNYCTQIAVLCAFCGPFRDHNRPSAVSSGTIYWCLRNAGVMQPGDTMGEVGQLHGSAIASALSVAVGRKTEESILRDASIIRECLVSARREALTWSTA